MFLVIVDSSCTLHGTLTVQCTTQITFHIEVGIRDNVTYAHKHRSYIISGYLMAKTIIEDPEEATMKSYII